MPIKDFTPKDWIVTLLTVIVGGILIGGAFVPLFVELRPLSDARANMLSAMIGSIIMIISQHITTNKTQK